MSETGYYLMARWVDAGWLSGGVWFFNGETATLVTNGLPAATFRVNSGESIEEAAARCYTLMWPPADKIRITRLQLSPGQFYNKIARPIDGRSMSLPLHRPGGEESTFHQTNLRTLVNILERILLVVYPSDDTINTYGNEIRNLLILACTECEAQWRAVLQDNGIQKERYTTKDYVHIEQSMKLRDYKVSFSRYPSFAPVKPFGSWDASGRPTQDLAWYNAYNATKHNRIGNMRDATLGNAMTALGACWVMLIAQYGGPYNGDSADLREYFIINKKPDWCLEDSYFINVRDEHCQKWTAVNYPFGD